MGKRKNKTEYTKKIHGSKKRKRVVLSNINNEHNDNVRQCTTDNDNVLLEEEPRNSSSSPPLPAEPKMTAEAAPSIGRRLVDVEYFLAQLGEISNHRHGSQFQCKFNNLQIASEVRKGLDSKIILKCSMCAENFEVRTVQKRDDIMSVNHQLVSGIMSSGGGHSHLQTITASIDLPSISSSYYSSIHEDVCNWWETAAAQSMAEAVKEEANYAVSIGSVDHNGVPLISVAVDGCWSKRSYGKNYSALSGAAAIVGLQFGKVLYLGVKNKYCIVCARAAKNSEPPEHVCFKNYTGSSTAMESTIIVEGFKRSLPDHGVIFHKFVADGDSSTYKKNLDSRPYGNLVVEKIECKNHLLRNYCNALVKLSSDTSFPPDMRKVLKDRYLRLRTGVTYAIKHWGCQNLPHDEKIKKLSNDILNGPQHVFGNHENCNVYFCTPEKRRKEPVGLLAQLVACGLMRAIENLSKKLSYHSRSIIHNATSNLVESFNALVAKYVGGKRINFSSRRSYAGRCAAAVVSFNTGTLHTTTHNSIFGSMGNEAIYKLEQNRKNKVHKTKLIKKKPRTVPVLVSKDAHYGENSQQPDLSPEVYEQAKTAFIRDLRLSSAEREELERSTVLQRNCAEWMGRRRKLLTSSLFGDVCKRRDSTSCANLVKKIVYGSNISTVPAVRYGIDNEEAAIKQLENQENISIQNCGLFVDQDHEFLGTTPNGKYANGLVEIKCPASLQNFAIEDAMKKHPFWKWDSGIKSYVINKQHHWYFQIQGQLHITKELICMLGIWFGKAIPMKVYEIHRDDEFWKSKMETKLVRFYNDCLLPELVDPRYSRCMPIRDPLYITEAMEEKKKKLQRASNESGQNKSDG